MMLVLVHIYLLESESDLNLRVRVDKDLLFEFSHENRILGIDKLTKGSLSKFKKKMMSLFPSSKINR